MAIVGLAVGLAASVAVPAHARPVNPGYTGVVATSNITDPTARNVAGACAFSFVPASATPGRGTLVVVGTATATGWSPRVVQTTVVCEVFGPAGSALVRRDEPLPAVVANGVSTVGIGSYTVCVTAAARYTDAGNAFAPRTCRAGLR